jgi:hypothetical protein
MYTFEYCATEQMRTHNLNTTVRFKLQTHRIHTVTCNPHLEHSFVCQQLACERHDGSTLISASHHVSEPSSRYGARLPGGRSRTAGWSLTEVLPFRPSPHPAEQSHSIRSPPPLAHLSPGGDNRKQSTAGLAKGMMKTEHRERFCWKSSAMDSPGSYSVSSDY